VRAHECRALPVSAVPRQAYGRRQQRGSDGERVFSYRDLIECGETWRRLASGNGEFDNLPAQRATWEALSQLARVVLDPVWRQFGPVALTFGFCSAALRRAIQAAPDPRISPADDQHASCELNLRNGPVCAHQGAACDFKVAGWEERMNEVASWIVHNLDFDALYYNGRDRALHLSWGPKMRQMVVLMRTDPATGRRRPAGTGSGETGRAPLTGAIGDFRNGGAVDANA
jgi:hypothetical protein